MREDQGWRVTDSVDDAGSLLGIVRPSARMPGPRWKCDGVVEALRGVQRGQGNGEGRGG